MNKQAERGDLTQVELESYREASSKYYGSESVSVKPIKEVYYGNERMEENNDDRN